jgi:hypothetical protein
LERTAELKIESSYLGAGSDDCETVERAIRQLPAGPRRDALCAKFEESKKSAQGQLSELNRAIEELDVGLIIDMSASGNASARRQLLETLATQATKIKRKWKSALEQKLASVSLESDFTSEWSFLLQLQDVQDFQGKIDKAVGEMRDSLAAAELEASSALSYRLDRRVS